MKTSSYVCAEVQAGSRMVSCLIDGEHGDEATWTCPCHRAALWRCRGHQQRQAKLKRVLGSTLVLVP